MDRTTDPMAQIEAALANVLSAAMRYARVHHDIGNTRMIEASEKELEMERTSLLALIRSALADKENRK